MQVVKYASERIQTGFETQGRYHRKPKTEVSVDKKDKCVKKTKVVPPFVTMDCRKIPYLVK